MLKILSAQITWTDFFRKNCFQGLGAFFANLKVTNLCGMSFLLQKNSFTQHQQYPSKIYSEKLRKTGVFVLLNKSVELCKLPLNNFFYTFFIQLSFYKRHTPW